MKVVDVKQADELVESAGQAHVEAAVIPLSDQATVEKEADGWANHWADSSEYVSPCFGTSNNAALPALAEWALRDAAKALSLRDTESKTSKNEKNPSGCYYRHEASSDRLWFNSTTPC